MVVNTTDVAIVGGGVIGCSIAYYLAKQGVSSTVFEQRRFGWGASGATAGVVGPLRHATPPDSPIFALGLRSLEMFPTLAAGLLEAGLDPQFRQSGILRIALTPEHVEILTQELAWQGELGLGVSWLEAGEVLDREPEINPAVLGALFSPREGHVHGQHFVDSLVHAASRLGVTFLEGVEVLGLETRDQQVTGVRTANGTFSAGQTVLAAGPWAGLSGRWLPGLKLPVRPVKGQRILLKKTGFLPRCPVNNFAGYVVPHSDGNVLVGATRHESEFDQEITADGLTRVMANGFASFPGLREARFVEARAGVRPGSPDDLPILGPVPGWKGLSLATGHDAVGVMLAPGTAQLIADYITSGDPKHLAPFSPARFGLRPQ